MCKFLKELGKSLWDFFLQHESLRYIFAGALTTAVNILLHTALRLLFGEDYTHLWNVIAIAGAIVFAFFINRGFVFRASDGTLWNQLLRFFASRILVGLLFEEGSYWLFLNVLGIHSTTPILPIQWAKLWSQLFSLIANYLCGKFFVFRKTL